MVDYDILFAIIFYTAIFLYYITHKNKFEVQGKIFIMYKTKLGISWMDKISKISPRLLNLLGGLGIFVGYAGMLGIFYVLIRGTIKLLTVENAVPVLAPVLPGVDIPGLPALSFWHWIIAILIVATIHEFSHGVLARVHGVKVNSSGFAFLGPILAAFVEPDEKEMEKKSKYKQLSVFAAGPWSNILTGIVFFFIWALVLSPISSGIVDFEGVQIMELKSGFPAEKSGLKLGDKITEINGVIITTPSSFQDILKEVKPGEEIVIKTESDEFRLTATKHPENPERGFLGVSVSSSSFSVKESVTNEYGKFLPSLLLWIVGLFYWLYLISIGIGLANLLPLGPVDGGRMALTGLSFFIKKEKVAYKAWMIITSFTLILILINLMPYIIKLFNFIIGPIIALL